MMKKVLPCFVILLAFLMYGCEKNPAEEYGNALIGAHEKGKVAAKIANLRGIQDSINAYRAAHGEYPRSLKDVESILGSPIDTSLYEYNPDNGQLLLKQ